LSNLKWWHWLIIGLVSITVLGAIVPSSDNGESTNGASEEVSEQKDSDDEPADKRADCIQLPGSVMSAIASGEQDGVGMSPVIGYAIKSPDFSNVYFMAIEFKATGIGNQVGVWARNGIETGIIMSVDGFAKQFTVWPDASKTDAQISGADRNIDAVKSCY